MEDSNVTYYEVALAINGYACKFQASEREIPDMVEVLKNARQDNRQCSLSSSNFDIHILAPVDAVIINKVDQVKDNVEYIKVSS